MTATRLPTSNQPLDRPASLRLWIGLLLLFVLSRLVFFFGFDAGFSDTRLYFSYAEAFQNAETLGAFFLDRNFEYPPLMLPVMLLPATLAGWFGDLSQTAYTGAFRACMAVCDGIVMLALIVAIRRLRPHSTPIRQALTIAPYLVLPLLLPDLLYDRLDLAVAATVMVAVALLACGRRSWGAAILGLAVALKLTPLLLLPPLLLWAWMSAAPAKRGQAFWGPLAAGVSGLLIGFVPFWLAAGDGVFGFVAYQSGRGLQLESVPASIGMLSIFVDAKLVPIEEARALSLLFPGSTVLQTLFAGLLLAGLAGLCGWFVWRRRAFADPEAGLSLALWAGLLMLAAAMALSNVFSPQYFFWLIPLALLLPLDGRQRAASLAGLTLILLLSWALFPHYYRDLVMLRPHAMALLMARNGLFVAWTLWLGQTLRPQLRSSRL